ncbi:MAG: leucine-rich repeat protein [Ruminococcus sp.]|nr:leucine-rich repeat protein [Ruminococcus sp.]
MKKLKIFTAAALVLIITAMSALTALTAESYIVLQGFAFDLNSSGEAVIHSYDDRSAEVVIPQKLLGADVTLIDDYAFFGDTVITSVSFDRADKLKKIGVNAFHGCSGLSSVEIPSWLEELSFGSFQNCSSLSELTINSGITEIPDQCFYGCSMLESVAIPESVTSIGDRAFTDCSILGKIEIPGTVEEIASNAFDNCNNAVIYCEKESYARYYAEQNGIDFVLTDAEMYKLGDANGDKRVNVNDVTAIQRHIADIFRLQGVNILAADTNQNLVTDINDATNLQMFLAGYDIIDPIGKVIIT